MKLIFYFLLSICYFFGTIIQSYAQNKPQVFSGSLSFDSVRDGVISNDGKFVFYTIDDHLFHRKYRLQSIEKGFIKDFTDPTCDIKQFSEDSRKLVYTKKGGLFVYDLFNRREENLGEIERQVMIRNKNSELLIYHKQDGRLIIRKLKSGIENFFDGVNQFWVNQSGSSLVLVKQVNGLYEWWFIDIFKNLKVKVYQGLQLNQVSFSPDGNRVVFLSGESIFYLNRSSNQTNSIVQELQLRVPENFIISGISNFARDNHRVLIEIQNKKIPGFEIKKSVADVKVWSYLDPILQSLQLSQTKESAQSPKYKAMLNLHNCSITFLEDIKISKQNTGFELPANGLENFALFRYDTGNGSLEAKWNQYVGNRNFIVNTHTGQSKEIPGSMMMRSSLSPNGKYVLLNNNSRVFYCYNVLTGKMVDITNVIPIPDFDVNNHQQDNGNNIIDLYYKGGLEVAGWLGLDDAIILYDTYDLWKVDPSGIKSPICLTKNYGRKSAIQFRIVGLEGSNAVIKQNRFLLSAFDQSSMQSGFYKLDLQQPGIPQKLVMSDAMYESISFVGAEPIRKAKDRDVYLIKYQSPSIPFNYVITENFRKFIELSNIRPAKSGKWFTRRLLTFRSLNGHLLHGILYMPSDLDSTKKYPVIINYYQSKSMYFNAFLPDYRQEGAGLEAFVPWFTNQDYLMFIPDIIRRVGHPGEDALACINDATDELIKLRFVDSTKLGLQGHSFGGYETNFIVTHSKRYSAAMSASGVSSLILEKALTRGNGLGEGFSLQDWVEEGQYKIGETFWARPDLYMRNSPVYFADKITTPLLIMHNKNDGSVPFINGFEMFTSLRRLGKPCWMLQYDGEGHVISKPENVKDYITRITQFFDHYLKGFPAPIWMTRGVSIEDNNEIQSGLKYDSQISSPGAGLLNLKEQKKVEEYSKLPLIEKLERKSTSNNK